MIRFAARLFALFMAFALVAGSHMPVAAAPGALPIQQETPTAPPVEADANSTIFLPMVTRGLNVSIARLELTQAIQSAGNSVTLVQGRPTVARVFVQSSSANVGNLRVTLSARRAGVLLAGSPAVRTGVTAHVYPDRANRTHSVNLLLPASWLAGDVVVTAQVALPNGATDALPADNRVTRAISFVRVPPLMLAVMPILHIDSDGFGTFPAPTTFSFPASVQAMFPVPSLAIRKRAPFTFVGALEQSREWERLLYTTIAVAKADGSPFAEVYLGQLADVPWSPYLGLASLHERAAVTMDIGLVPAHELGHTLGRLHAPCGDPANPDPDYPAAYANAVIGQYGWDTRNGTVHLPSEHDLMSYCEQWISDYTYLGMMENQIFYGDPTTARGHLAEQPAGAESVKGSATQVLIQASLTDEANPRLLPVYALETFSRAAPAADAQAGNYTIAFVDAQGVTLSEHGVQSEELEERGLLAHLLTALVPLPPGEAAAVELRQGAHVVASRRVNAGVAGAGIAATAAISGEELVITLPAQTAATGLDASSAPVLVRHLHAHGTDTLALTDRSLSLPLASLAGGPGRIEFVYPDVIPQAAGGASVGAAAFTLPDRLPEAWIGAPRQAPLGAGVLVDGYGSDREDGALTSLRWIVNGQPAGEGPVLQLDEVAAPLDVELVVTDGQGQTATARTLLAPLSESTD